MRKQRIAKRERQTREFWSRAKRERDERLRKQKESGLSPDVYALARALGCAQCSLGCAGERGLSILFLRSTLGLARVLRVAVKQLGRFLAPSARVGVPEANEPELGPAMLAKVGHGRTSLTFSRNPSTVPCGRNQDNHEGLRPICKKESYRYTMRHESSYEEGGTLTRLSQIALSERGKQLPERNT